MIRCDICKKTVFDADKTIVDWEKIKEATRKGFVPNYYLERDKEGIEYGLPKERKWKNIVKTYPRESMELCKECLAEMNNVFVKKNSRAFYCYIATAAFESADAPEVKLLRRYRDHVLDEFLIGRIFINIYYTVSPPFARIVDNSAFLRKILRKYILVPLIKRIQRKHGVLLSSVRVKGYIPE